MGSKSSKEKPQLECVPFCDTRRFMGVWFVIACKPTYFETSACNAVERYSLVDPPALIPLGAEIKINFTYKNDGWVGKKTKSIDQKAWVASENGAQWMVSPMWPIKIPHLILEVDEENYEWFVFGVPSRAYCWVLCRSPVMDKVLFDDLRVRLEKKHLYDLKGWRVIPQNWTKEELREMGVSHFKSKLDILNSMGSVNDEAPISVPH